MAKQKSKTHGEEKLPDLIYVERDFRDNSVLLASERTLERASLDDTTRVAVYQFVRFVDLVNKTEVRPV